MLTFRVCITSISLYSSCEMLTRKLGNDTWLVCSSRTIQIAAEKLSLKGKMAISNCYNGLGLGLVLCRIAQYVCQVRITWFRLGSLNQNSRRVYFEGLYNSQSSIYERAPYLRERRTKKNSVSPLADPWSKPFDKAIARRHRLSPTVLVVKTRLKRKSTR